MLCCGGFAYLNDSPHIGSARFRIGNGGDDCGMVLTFVRNCAQVVIRPCGFSYSYRRYIRTTLCAVGPCDVEGVSALLLLVLAGFLFGSVCMFLVPPCFPLSVEFFFYFVLVLPSSSFGSFAFLWGLLDQDIRTSRHRSKTPDGKKLPATRTYRQHRRDTWTLSAGPPCPAYQRSSIATHRLT